MGSSNVCYKCPDFHPPLEGAGRHAWSAAPCVTGWGDGLSPSNTACVERLPPHLGSHFMRTDPPPPGEDGHRRLPRRALRQDALQGAAVHVETARGFRDIA